MVKRIIALSVIFTCSWIAWGILTLVVHLRTDEKSESNSAAVGQLWGTEHTQVAPRASAAWTTVVRREVERTPLGWEYVDEDAEGAGEATTGPAAEPDGERPAAAEPERAPKLPGAVSTETVSRKVVTEKAADPPPTAAGRAARRGKRGAAAGPEERSFEITEYRHEMELPLGGTDARVDLDVDYRKKGLMWFSTYDVGFAATYAVANPLDRPIVVTMVFGFPSPSAVYDNMKVQAPGRGDLEVTAENGQMVGRFTLPGGQQQRVSFAYQSRGMDRWNYRFGDDVKLVEDFRLALRTNFEQIDFPLGSISPDVKRRRGEKPGWELAWEKESLVSGLEIGMLMPHRINPGPLAEAMSLHAPVSLFFFFFVIFILQVLKDIRIHPMNYFFLAASFFAFNLLFSYLVDHLDIFVAFAVASAVSIGLVVTYLKLVVGARFALVEAGVSQLVYQVLFGLAHFWEGYTGLTVTIGAIITLAIVMLVTARIDWEKVFGGRPRTAPDAPATGACRVG